MRFDELTIEKYGFYSSKTIDLASTPGLAILYGPNEAGKSTTLSAVMDFLYGIPTRTPHGGVFGYPAMAITASLRFADGSNLRLKRTKGSAGTLKDGSGALASDSLLTAHLGVNNRDRFASLFALNHETLRSGGEKLLDANGDIGRIIVEAGGGLRSLAAEIAALSARADAIYSSRRAANRAFYVELDRYQEADKQIKEGLLTVEVYERVHREAKAASKLLEDLRKQLHALRESHSSLERMARVCPLLHQLERMIGDLAAYSDLPDFRGEHLRKFPPPQPLPPGEGTNAPLNSEQFHAAEDFAQLARRAISARSEAQESLETIEAHLGELKAKTDVLQPALPLINAEVAIITLATWGVHVSKERTDREERRVELARSRSRLEGLRRLTGLAPDADIASIMPGLDDLSSVRSLAAESTRLQTEIRGLEARVKEVDLRINQLHSLQAKREAAGYHQPLGFDAAAFMGLESASGDLGLRRAQIDEIDQEISRKIRALGFDSFNAIVNLTLPDDSALKMETDRIAAHDVELRHLKEAVTRETRRKSAKSAEVAGLRGAGEPPTDEAITSARQVRLSAWEPIRQAYLNAASASEVSLEERLGSVRSYEDRTAGADSLVDRKSIEAGRVAQLKLAEQEMVEAEHALLAAHSEITALEEQVRAASEAWAQSWPDASRLHAEPNRLSGKLAERTAILQLDAQARSLKTETDRLAVQVESGIATIGEAEKRLGIEVNPNASLVARLHAVTQRTKQHADEYADYRAAKKGIEDESTRKLAATGALDELKTALIAWEVDWSNVLSRLHLKPGTSPAAATEAATEWAAAQGQLDAINLTQKRLDKMERDEKRLEEMVAEIAPVVGIDLPSDVVAASELLKRKLDEAMQIQSTRTAFEQQAAALAPSLQRATGALDAARVAVASLCESAGCEESELAAMAARFEERAACLERIRQLEQTLRASGDQLPIDSLREQLGGRDIDQISAAIEEEKEREKALLAEMESAVKEEERLRQQLAGYSSGAESNRPVAARESAAAAMRQAVSDYLELALAKELIEEAMAAVREEQQDPLLARAGALFQQATTGAFNGIRADVDDRGNPSVVGVRANSADRVPLDAMSDGTRDQLFLAFRVAAVEQYCASAEPLPFIADDLLVHFDDGRSLAALELLAELGKTTQVLLFTHHSKVRDSAADLVKRGLAGVVEIA